MIDKIYVVMVLQKDLLGVSARAYSRKIDISEPAIPSPLNTHSIDPYTTTSTSDWIMSTIQPDKHIKEYSYGNESLSQIGLKTIR
jgi:hypothetical protein